MRGIWSQEVTLAVIVQIVLISGKSLIQNNQQVQQQFEQQSPNENVAQKRVGYDYPAPPNDLFNPFQDHSDHHDHHGEHHIQEHHEEHHDHHDPGYWKKKLIWKPGWKKIWKPSKKQVWKPSWKKVYKQVWVPHWKDIWLPGVKKIWRPVWISEWFPSPDHHEHVHQSHGWDRSDNNTAVSQKSVATKLIPQQQPSPRSQSSWQFPK